LFLQRFFEEVIRRKVLPVAVAYAIGGWVLLQVGDVLIGLLELPGWTGKILVAVTLLGLPVALILAWVYDCTPKGIIATGAQPSSGSEFRFGEPELIDLSELELPRPELGELIGRHAECDTLREYLEAARNGTGGIVLISGEPGVGKSRLGEEALVLAGEKDEAAKLYPLLRRYFESPSSRVVFLYGLQEKSAAIAAAASTVWENAERHFENSLKLAEELPHRVDQARVRYWYARMLLDRAQAGDREQAQALLAEARSLSEEMGMHGLIRRIDTLTSLGIGELAEISDHQVRARRGQCAHVVGSRDTDDQTEFAVAAGLDARDRILDHDCLLAGDTEPPGCIEKGIRCRFAREAGLGGDRAVDDGLETLGNPSGGQHRRRVLAGRHDCHVYAGGSQLVQEAHRAGIGLDTIPRKNLVDQHVLAIAEGTDRGCTRRIRGIAFRQLDVAGSEEAPDAIIAGLAVEVAVVIASDVEFDKWLACTVRPLAQILVEHLFPAI